MPIDDSIYQSHDAWRRFSEAEDTALSEGQIYDNQYKVIRHLGSGGMGSVYLVEDTLMEDRKALKRIRPELAMDIDVRRRFIQEVGLSQRIVSHHVVRVHGARQYGDELYYTMEFLDGESLRDRLDSLDESGEMLELDEVKRLARAIGRGLQDAHRVTLHRDLKPDNVFLLKDGGVKLLDFGLARALKGSGLTMDARRMGTAYYMAPEQLSRKAVTPHATLDIFALGVMLYEMLTLEVPMGIMEPVSDIRDDVPDGMDAFIRKCLTKNPSRRPQSVDEFLTAFNALFESSSPVIDVKSPEPRTSNLEPRTSNLEPRTRNHEPGTAHREPGTEMIVPDIDMKLIWVPPGSFMMGSNGAEANDSEKPVHKVTIHKGYWIGKYPVTQGEYSKVTGRNPSRYKGIRHPVEQVSWEDAIAFCRRSEEMIGLPFSLPTEAQWEYAAAGGPLSKSYRYSGSNLVNGIAWCQPEQKGTHPVGKLSSNELGIYDMSGNVWEWCMDDWHDNYNGAPDNGSRWGDGTLELRVHRGGSWNNSARSCRVTSRDRRGSDNRWNTLGFRVVLNVEPRT